MVRTYAGTVVCVDTFLHDDSICDKRKTFGRMLDTPWVYVAVQALHIGLCFCQSRCPVTMVSVYFAVEHFLNLPFCRFTTLCYFHCSVQIKVRFAKKSFLQVVVYQSKDKLVTSQLFTNGWLPSHICTYQS